MPGDRGCDRGDAQQRGPEVEMCRQDRPDQDRRDRDDAEREGHSRPRGTEPVQRDGQQPDRKEPAREHHQIEDRPVDAARVTLSGREQRRNQEERDRRRRILERPIPVGDEALHHPVAVIGVDRDIGDHDGAVQAVAR
jgi:hypothetical protein